MVAIAFVLFLLAPAMLVASVIFPFYWIGQFRLLLRTGSWKQQAEFRARSMNLMGRAIAVVYVISLGTLCFPGIFPKVRDTIENTLTVPGWTLGFLVPMILDLAILMALSPDRAVEIWRSHNTPRP